MNGRKQTGFFLETQQTQQTQDLDWLGIPGVEKALQYKYYREGLHTMAENVDRGRTAVTEAIEMLKTAKDNKPMSMLPQIWTEYKRDELVGIYQGKGTTKEKESVSTILSSINASQNVHWNKIKK